MECKVALVSWVLGSPERSTGRRPEERALDVVRGAGSSPAEGCLYHNAYHNPVGVHGGL
jgi:hypothetical protein